MEKLERSFMQINKSGIVSITLSLLLMLLSATVLMAQNEKRPIIQATRTIGNLEYVYKFGEQDFADTPVWNQDQDEPPLSVSKAVSISRGTLPRFVSNAETWKMWTITLESFGSNSNIWYYRVMFLCNGAACRELKSRSFNVIVKMDGSIIEPKKVTVEN